MDKHLFYAGELDRLAGQIESVNVAGPAGKWEAVERAGLYDQAGRLLAEAHADGCLPAWPELDERIRYHTGEPDEAERGQQAMRVRCAFNLFSDVVGGNLAGLRVDDNGAVNIEAVKGGLMADRFPEIFQPPQYLVDAQRAAAGGEVVECQMLRELHERFLNDLYVRACRALATLIAGRAPKDGAGDGGRLGRNGPGVRSRLANKGRAPRATGPRSPAGDGGQAVQERQALGAAIEDARRRRTHEPDRKRLSNLAARLRGLARQVAKGSIPVDGGIKEASTCTLEAVAAGSWSIEAEAAMQHAGSYLTLYGWLVNGLESGAGDNLNPASVSHGLELVAELVERESTITEAPPEWAALWSVPMPLKAIAKAVGVQDVRTVHNRYGHALRQLNRQTFQIDIRKVHAKYQDNIAPQ